MSELAKALAEKDLDPEVVVCQGDPRFKSEYVTISPAAFRKAFTGRRADELWPAEPPAPGPPPTVGREEFLKVLGALVDALGPMPRQEQLAGLRAALTRETISEHRLMDVPKLADLMAGARTGKKDG